MFYFVKIWLLGICVFTVLFILAFCKRGPFRYYNEYRTHNLFLVFAIYFLVPLVFLCFLSVVKDQDLCPNCREMVSSTYCQACGQKVIVEPTCPSCGAEWDSTYCGDCGSLMNLEG